jgi:hypothetical protein
MTARDDYFERFRWSCFDLSVGATRDGVDADAIAHLSPADRSRAEEMVLAALRETNDSRPFVAAGIMRLKSASPVLKQRFSHGPPLKWDYLRVHLAHALYLIDHWSDAASTIVGVLHGTPKTLNHQWTRMIAVESLVDFRRDSFTLPVLFAAVEDEDDFIGFLAIRTLKTIYAKDHTIAEILAELERTQLKPNRWVPDHLRRRKELFAELEESTRVPMPSVCMKKKEDIEHEFQSDGKQLPLLTEEGD